MATDIQSLDQQFQAAADQVNNLPPNVAADQMTDLYGLYKQATEGDEDMKGQAVDADAATKPSGPGGLSQAQWDSWSKYKGTPQDAAKRQYVSRVAELTIPGYPAEAVPTQPETGAPTAADHGGLRGDITAGAPYGGEDKLKKVQ